MPISLSYADAIQWLYTLQNFGIKLGLEPIQRLVTSLNLTVHSTPARRFVHGGRDVVSDLSENYSSVIDARLYGRLDLHQHHRVA